jgi:hypothetical protein
MSTLEQAGGMFHHIRTESTADNCVIRLFPTLALGSPAGFIDGTGHCLCVITVSGQLFAWCVPSGHVSRNIFDIVDSAGT